MGSWVGSPPCRDQGTPSPRLCAWPTLGELCAQNPQRGREEKRGCDWVHLEEGRAQGEMRSNEGACEEGKVELPVISPEQREPSCQLPLHPGSCEGEGGQGGPETHCAQAQESGSHTCVRSFPVGMGTHGPAWEKHWKRGVCSGGLCISPYIVVLVLIIRSL